MKKSAWKRSQQILFPLVITAIFLISSVYQNSNPNFLSNLGDISSNGIASPINALMDMDTPITGLGDNRTVRVFMENMSTATGQNQFNITSEDDEEYLYDGQLNFTFSPNYQTNYTLEDDSSLENPMLAHYSTLHTVKVVTGTEDIDPAYPLIIDSASLDGLNQVRFNVTTRFENSSITDLKQMVGFRVDFYLTLNHIVNLNISAKDHVNNNWKSMEITQQVNVVNNIRVTYFLRNENTVFVNSTKHALFSFGFYNSSSSFKVTVHSMSIRVLRGYEQTLLKNNPLALEFDTKGDCEVYGFQAWIRPFNIYNITASTTNLTIQLYRTNQTTPLKRSSFLLDSRTILKAEPKTSGILLAENSYLNFNVDKPFWFFFKSDQSGISLNVSNYFIVISTNASGTIGDRSFTLVILPWTAPTTSLGRDPDNHIDHLLLRYTTKWELIKTGFLGYAALEVADAAKFAINLTRGYFPTEISAKIQNGVISDTYLENYPHDTIETDSYYGQYWWGLGTIDHQFSPIIQASSLNFTITLSWDTEIFAGDLDFSVIYCVQKFFNDEGLTVYTLAIGADPSWNVTFDFDATMMKFLTWNLTQLWFYTPLDWTLSRFTALGEDCFTSTILLSPINGSQVLVANTSIVQESGFYILFATSPNYLHELSTYLLYGTTELKTNGFMRGDSVIVRVGALESDQDYLTKPGSVSVSLFNPSEDLMPTHVLFDSLIDSNTTYSYFNFDDTEILITDASTPLGTFTIIGNWTNGEEVGIIQSEFYLNQYTGSIEDILHNREDKTHQVYGTITTFTSNLDYYSFALYGVQNLEEDSTDTWIVNHTESLSLGSDLYLTRFAQNETLLNAEEQVDFQIIVENRHLTLDYDLTAKIDIIYYQHSDWILCSVNTTQWLNISGAIGNSDLVQYNLSVVIPSIITGGVNCPIRNAPLVIQISFLLENSVLKQKLYTDYLYYTPVLETEFEGQVINTKIYENRLGPSFIASLDRTDLRLPGNVMYFLQVYDGNFITMSTEANYNMTDLLVDGEFTSIVSSPSTISHLSNVTLTGEMVDEFGDPLGLKEIAIYFDNRTNFISGSPVWIPLKVIGEPSTSNITTDEDGVFTADISLLQTPIGNQVSILFSFNGSTTYLAFSKVVNLTLVTYRNGLSIAFDSSKVLFIDNHNLISLSITNTGNSTIENLNIQLNSQYNYKIRNMSVQSGYQLLPDEIYTVQIDFFDTSFIEQTVTIDVFAYGTTQETAEHVEITEEYTLKTYTVNSSKLGSVFLILGSVLGLLAIWFFSIRYILKTRREINAPLTPSDVSKVAPKRTTGKYVKISELQSQPPSPTEKQPETTTLDDLLDAEKKKQK